jgi:hypothetical protein
MPNSARVSVRHQILRIVLPILVVTPPPPFTLCYHCHTMIFSHDAMNICSPLTISYFQKKFLP